MPLRLVGFLALLFATLSGFLCTSRAADFRIETWTLGEPFEPIFPERASQATVLASLDRLANPATLADESWETGTSYCSLFLSGFIGSTDVAKLTKLFADVSPSGQCGQIGVVVLSGPGGDVDAAMAMGRVLRRHQVTTRVAESESCGSACVLVFLGGVWREVWGQLDIHRPYPVHLSKTYQESQQAYVEIRVAIESYLRELNIPSSAGEMMLSIPSSDALSIGRLDAVRYGFAGVDPPYQDRLDSSWAAYYKLTKTDYYQKRQMALSLCKTQPSEPSAQKCFYRVLRGAQ